MTIKRTALGILTLGGHDKLEKAQEEYASVYSEYQRESAALERAQARYQESINQIGAVAITAMGHARSAKKILIRDGRDGFGSLQPNGLGRGKSHAPSSVQRADRILKSFDSALSLAGGAGAGAAMAAGSWTMVAMLGSASTGTAISTLSGAAATNATLAWFGGGALAAGGAGMAGGTMVLGGIAAAPVIAVMAWRSRTKTKAVIEETSRVRAVVARVVRDRASTEEALTSARLTLGKLRPPAQVLERCVVATSSLLYPVRGWSLIKRWTLRLFGLPFYTEAELPILLSLQHALEDFLAVLDDTDGACQFLPNIRYCRHGHDEHFSPGPAA